MGNGDVGRERREAYAAKLLASITPYAEVGRDARLRAIHNELTFSIDRIIAEQPTARFNDAEIEVLRSIAVQVIYALESTYPCGRGRLAGDVRV